MSDQPEPPTPAFTRPAIRRRASAFHAAQRAASTRRSVLRVTAVAALVLVLTGATAGGFVASGVSSLPDDSLVARPLPSDTLIYDRTGKVLLADLHPPGYQHQQATLTEMGRFLPEATVAVEDANFWIEPGVDPLSIGRAAWTNFRAGEVVEGGSTITQQLVKRRLVGDDTTYSRKLREAVLAMRIAAAYSKPRILEMYLNSISYGNSAYGAAAAARIYFHVDPSRLDLAQASLLAGLPQNPTLLNPLVHWSAAKSRQRDVLNAMVRSDYVTQEQAEQAFAEDLSPPDHLFRPSRLNLAPGFVSYVSGLIADRYGKDAVQSGGLRVVTSLDWGLQQTAQAAVTDTVRANQRRDVTDGALVALDPRSGAVLAMVGSAGPDVPGGQYNMAVWPPRNPGSSFKVFTYAAAIDSRKYTMVTPITDAPLTVRPPGGQAYTPKNYDLRSHGVCQLQACLGNSLNVPAVEVELGTGVQNVVEQARKMGAPPFQQHDGRYATDDPATSFGPSLTLGGYGETPLQMATGVSVLAAQGVLHEPRAIVSVTRSDGTRLASDSGSGGRRVMDAGTAYIVGQMLSNDDNRTMIFGRGTPLTLAGHTAAAKTGTTDNFADGWTVGYTPSLATAVWMGNTDHHPMVQGTDGVYVAAPAWHDFMTAALDKMGKSDEWYDMPPDVEARTVGGRQAYFLQGTSPSTPAPALPSWARLGGGGSTGGSSGGSTGPGCRTWTYNGGTYWACTPGGSGLPGDPGSG